MIYTNTISEEYVAAGVLNCPEEVIPQLKADGVTADYFHNHTPKLVWRLANKMLDEGKAHDITMLEFTDDVKGIDKDGHQAHDISRVRCEWCGFEILKNHIKTLKSMYATRFAHKSLSDTLDALSEGESPEVISDAARGASESIMGILQSQSGWKNSEQIGKEFIELLERLHQGGESTGTPSGIFSLDQATGGLSSNELWVVGAQTSGGKTVLMLQIMANFLQLGKKVLMFSLETEANMIAARIASNTQNVDMGKLLNKSSAPMDRLLMERISEYIDGLRTSTNLTICDEDSMTMESIMARSQQVNDLGEGIDLIVVDYIQLVTLANAKDKARHEQVAEVTRTLKQLAKRYQCPVITATQLNDDGKARESRAITHDADVYLTIFDDNIFLGKNRNGERDITLDLKLNGAYQRFQ